LTLLFLSNLAVGQDLAGKYKLNCCGSEISFWDDSVKFEVQSNGGLTIGLLGIGTFQRQEDFLFIETTDCQNLKSKATSSPKQNLSPEISIIDAEGEVVQFANVILLNNEGETIWGICTNSLGHAIIKHHQEAVQIMIAQLGCDPVVLDYNPDVDYHIRQTLGFVLDNRTVVFQINDHDEMSLTLTLVSEGLSEEWNNKRNLKKLRRVVKRTTYPQEKFEKSPAANTSHEE
jgi:hypothetical protein